MVLSLSSWASSLVAPIEARVDRFALNGSAIVSDEGRAPEPVVRACVDANACSHEARGQQNRNDNLRSLLSGDGRMNGKTWTERRRRKRVGYIKNCVHFASWLELNRVTKIKTTRGGAPTKKKLFAKPT